jgi:hypothetical protein
MLNERRHPLAGIRDPACELETGSLEVWKLETGNWKLETGNW